MTRQDFEKQRLSIENEKFLGDCSDPIVYGIKRAAFDCQKYKKLIAIAKQVKSQTARTKLEQWKRQLERACKSQDRFEKLRAEIQAGRQSGEVVRFSNPELPVQNANRNSIDVMQGQFSGQ